MEANLLHFGNLDIYETWNCQKQKQSRNWYIVIVNFLLLYFSSSLHLTVLFIQDMNVYSCIHISTLFHLFPCTLLFVVVSFEVFALRRINKQRMPSSCFIIFLFTCNHHHAYFVVMLKIKLDLSGNCLSACILSFYLSSFHYWWDVEWSWDVLWHTHAGHFQQFGLGGTCCY